MRSGIRVHGGPAVRLALIGALATFGPSSVSVAQDPPRRRPRRGSARPASATSRRGPPR
jgi:hypothetical protein